MQIEFTGSETPAEIAAAAIEWFSNRPNNPSITIFYDNSIPKLKYAFQGGNADITCVYRLLLYFMYIVIIGLSIGLFPRTPRFSLTFISFSILILLGMATSEVADVRKKEHEKDTLMLAQAVVSLHETVKHKRPRQHALRRLPRSTLKTRARPTLRQTKPSGLRLKI